MKHICISYRIFSKCIGYGLWSLLTIGLLYTIFASNYENGTLERNLYSSGWDIEYCYTNVSNGFTKTCFDSSDHYYHKLIEPIDRLSSSSVAMIFNAIFIGIWLYHKQQKFKFAWCENLK